MVASAKFIWWLQDVSRHDAPDVGGKGANLGELIGAGVPVPPGFVVGAAAYQQFLRHSGLSEALQPLLASLNVADFPKLEATAQRVKARLLAAALPANIEMSIRAAYHQLGSPPVAVRSSATAEDLAEASFAGQQSTFLNVQGADAVINAVRACWASLFEATAIAYRARHGFDHLTTAMAVPVQQMVQSEAAGVLFTVDPVTGDTETIVLEAALGLGEALVGGEITPDLYTISKNPVVIRAKELSVQEWKLVRNVHGQGPVANVRVPIPATEQSVPKLSDAQILSLAELGLIIERHYGAPQDIEWAIEGDNIFIVQARPITTL